MKNNKPTIKELPNNTKFATHKFGNKDDILLEYLIALQIYNGTSYSKLLEPINSFKNEKDKKDKKEMRIKINDIILNFIDLNLEYKSILRQNSKYKLILKFLV